MKIFIKIDLRTLRKNPDYTPPGVRKHLPAESTITFKCDKLPSFLKDEDNCVITTADINPENNFSNCSGFIKPNFKWKSSYKKEAKEVGLVVSKEQHLIDVTCKSNSLYLFSYLNPTIKCPRCENKYSKNQLEIISYVNEDGDDSYYYKCPHCTYSDFIFEFESVEQALKRKENGKNK